MLIFRDGQRDLKNTQLFEITIIPRKIYREKIL